MYTPSLLFAWADMQEILIPGTTFERVISGGDKDSNAIAIRVLLYLLFPSTIAAQLAVFLSGILILSFLWPNYMKQFIFNGKIEPLYMEQYHTQLESIHIAAERIRSELDAGLFIAKDIEEDIRFIGRRISKMTNFNLKHTKKVIKKIKTMHATSALIFSF